MSRKDQMDDARLRKLLAGHERPAWDRERFDRLCGEAGAPDGWPAFRVFPAPRPAPSPAAWIARGALLAAGLALVLGLAVLAKSQSGFDAPVAGYRWLPDTGWTASETPATGPTREFRTGPGEELRIASATELLSLGPDSRLSLRQDALRSPFGGNPMRYRLEAGGLWLEHRTSAPSFEVETALGRISPLGTAFSLRVGPDGITLVVREGAVRFEPRDSSAGRIVEAGSLLEAIPGPGLAVSLSVRPLDPALPPPYLPAAPALDAVPLRLPGGDAAAPGPQAVALQAATAGEAEAAAASVASILAAPDLAPESTAAPGATAAPRAGTQAGGPSGTSAPHPSSPTALASPAPRPAPSAAAATPSPLPRLLWSGVSAPAGLRRLDLDGPWLVATGARVLNILESATGRLAAELPLAADFSGLVLADRLYLQEGATLRCIDPTTGRELWTAMAGPSPFADPALSGGVLAVSSADGRLWLIDAATGKTLQTLAAGSGLYGTALRRGEAWLAATSNSLVSLSAASAAPGWTYRSAARLANGQPVALESGALVVADRSGQWLALDASGRPLWQAAYAAPLASGPWPAGDAIVYQDASGARRLDARGRILPLDNTLGRWLASGASGGQRLLVGTDGLGWYDLDASDQGPSRLLAGNWTKAASDGNLAAVAGPDGRLAAWSVPSPDSARQEVQP
jgi:ferric-dicitrate binding protein FerR (iron transport regulator)